MMLRRSLLAAAMLAFAGSILAAQEEPPKTRRAAAAAWSEDGLEKVSIKGLDVAFVRPGSSLAGYDKVLLRPPTVAFSRNWGRSSYELGGRVRPEEAQRIKDRLTQLVTQELSSEFKEGGYVLVQQAAADVLELEVRIVDLSIVAPDVLTANRKDIYAVSAGEMTLIAEMRDSASGESIMRIYDHEEADRMGRIHRITRVENVAEATELTRSWAKALRKQLDAARAGSSQ